MWRNLDIRNAFKVLYFNLGKNGSSVLTYVFYLVIIKILIWNDYIFTTYVIVLIFLFSDWWHRCNGRCTFSTYRCSSSFRWAEKNYLWNETILFLHINILVHNYGTNFILKALSMSHPFMYFAASKAESI